MWLIGAMVCLLVAPWVHLSVSAGNGWPHNALRHHWLMPISCHFRDCKALLVTSLTHVSHGAIASVLTFTFTITMLLCSVLRVQGFLRVISTTNGGQERKFVGGAMQLSDRLAAQLPTGAVRLSTPVVRVDQRSGDGVTVTAGTGSTYTGQYAISAVPLALLNRIEFQPALSGRKLQLIQSMPMGSCIKTMTYYDKPYWRRTGFSGSATDVGVTVWCIDDTKPDGSAPCILGFVNGAYVSVDDILSRANDSTGFLFSVPSVCLFV